MDLRKSLTRSPATGGSSSDERWDVVAAVSREERVTAYQAA